MAKTIERLKDAHSNVLFANKRRKNTYQPLEAGAYPRKFIKQLEEAHRALLTGDLSRTKMVREDSRSGRYLLSIGFGAKHTWFANDYIPRGEFAAYGSLEEVAEGVRALYDIAHQGEFDEALEELRERRQAHAAKMLSYREPKVTGFNPRNAMLPSEQLSAAA